jgi:hypothetical protein
VAEGNSRRDGGGGDDGEANEPASSWMAELNGIISAGQVDEGEEENDQDDDPDYGSSSSSSRVKLKLLRNKCQICGRLEVADMPQHIRAVHAEWILPAGTATDHILLHRYPVSLCAVDKNDPRHCFVSAIQNRS